MSRSKRIRKFYRDLFDRYGPQGWWPGESGIECILGAILTQNTSWKNVEKAIDNLKRDNLISIESLNLITTDELARLIRSSGYYNQKALKIKTFIRFVVQEYSGSLENMFAEQSSELRQKLLGIKGIGSETADSIMLYAGGIPVFVVDTYTYRILSRHGLVPENTSYEEIQELFMDSLEKDSETFNEYHALLVKLGKEHCKKSSPVCEGCPLEYDPHFL
jgi:endonuclease-3 related protein